MLFYRFGFFFLDSETPLRVRPSPGPRVSIRKAMFFFFFPRKSPVFYKNNSVLLSFPPLVAGRGAVLTFVILPLLVYVFSASGALP
jgi:hypothetical protein